MESDKIAVSLGLDLSDYSKDIQSALKILDAFEKNFKDEFKLEVDTSSLTKIASKELDNLQKALKKIDDSDYELNVKLKYAKEELGNALEQQKMSYGRRGEVEKADKRVSVAQENLESIKARIHANDVAAEDVKSRIDELFKDLINLSDLKFENINNISLATEAREIQKMAESADLLNDALDESPKQVRKTTDETTILGTVFARLAKQIKRQMYTSVASLLNPINNFKKVFSYLTDVLSPRLGATFKNIGNNLTEYFASSPVFQNLIHQALYFVYILQSVFNVLASIFKWRQIDLFKVSAKTSKEIAKNASNTVASFDEINDIGNQNNTADQTPMGVGELFSADEMEKAQKIAENLRPIFESIEKVIKKIKDHWKEILIVLGIVVATILVIKGIQLFKSLFGDGDGGVTNLTGLADGVGKLASKAGDALIIIAALGGIALVLNQLADVLTIVDGMTGNVQGKMTGLAIVVGSLSVLVLALAAAAKLCASPEAMVGLLEVTAALVIILEVLKDTLPTILEHTGNFIEKVAPPLKSILDTLIGHFETIIDKLGNVLPPIINSIGKLFTTIFTNVQNLIKTVGEVIVKILQQVDSTVNNVFTGILNFINKLGPAVNNLVDNIIKAVTKVINFFVSGIEYLINTIIIKPINSLIGKVQNGAIGELLDWVGIPQLSKIGKVSVDRFIPSYDVGTNYVPNDQIAMIHKGEAIIPKEFNDKTYFGNNDETNSLLEQLIEKVDNIDFAPYTTVKDVGRASVDYIKNTSRRLGRSLI